ncbi:MAG: hypothetical protein RBR32_06695 [Bacteroidales bacterium]|nr:hypothetical protein [Bacteroidales bacterium]
MNSDKLYKIICERETEYDLAKKKLKTTRIELGKLKKKLSAYEKTKATILLFAARAKEETKKYIENTITLALEIVFGKEYKAVLEVKDQEVKFLVDKGGILLEPREEQTSGGLVDIYNLALQITSHKLEPNTEPVFFLDQPCDNLDHKRKPLAAKFIKTITKDLNLQMNIITHEEEFIKIGDNVITLGEKE